jgi:hypothetical protein
VSAVAFDTLKFAEKLESGGFTPQQAKAAAQAFAEASADQLATKTDISVVRTDIEALRLATKSDIEALRLGTKSDIETLRLGTKSDIEALRLGTKSDIEALRLGTKSDLAEMKSEILKWMFGTIGFQTIVILGAVLAVSRFGH